MIRMKGAIVIWVMSSSKILKFNKSVKLLQKYFAEPYFSICFFCCRSVLPSWLPEHPELPELPELPNCPNFRTAGTP